MPTSEVSGLVGLAERIGALGGPAILALAVIGFLCEWWYTRGAMRREREINTELRTAVKELTEMNRKGVEEDRVELRQLRELLVRLTDELTLARRRSEGR